ncbi:MAG: hypothetical protein IJT73_03280, partial [Selenomonadaceae bacterium]|nr:hypothetical protein [Selenomonadaceae bacterium]
PRLAPKYSVLAATLAAFFVSKVYLKSEMMLTIRLAPEIAKLIIWYFVIDITSPLGESRKPTAFTAQIITEYFHTVKVDEIKICGYNFSVNDFWQMKKACRFGISTRPID